MDENDRKRPGPEEIRAAVARGEKDLMNIRLTHIPGMESWGVEITTKNIGWPEEVMSFSTENPADALLDIARAFLEGEIT